MKKNWKMISTINGDIVFYFENFDWVYFECVIK